MSSQQPDQVAAYTQFRDLFGNDEDLLLSVTPPHLLEPAGLDLIADLTRQIAEIDGVRQVLSLSNARQLVPGRYGAEDQPLLPQTDQYGNISVVIKKALQNNPHYEGLLVSADHRIAGLIIELVDRRADESLRRTLIQDVRNLMARYADRAEFHLTGVGVQKIDVADLIKRDQRVVLPLVVVVLMLLLGAIFRRLSGVLLPLLATVVSLIWTMGFYSLCGFDLNTISSLLPPVVMILAVSNSVHLYNGWLHIDGLDTQRIGLLSSKVDELLTPCFFTALTTALGLLSLTISGIPAVRQFGLFAALGAILSMLISLTLVPIFLSFLSLPEQRHLNGTGLLRWTLRNIAEVTIKRPKMILAVAALLLLIALFGLPQLHNNTNLVGFLRNNAPLSIDTDYIDRHLGGVNALEFMLTRRDGHALVTPDDYARLEKFELLAWEQLGVANVFSILPVLRQLHQAETRSHPLVLPMDGDELRYELDLLSMAGDQKLPRRFLTEDRSSARMSIWLHDIGSRSASETASQLLKLGESIFGSTYYLVPTGSYYQMIQDSNRLVSDMLKSFALSLLLVMLAIFLLLRSYKLTLLAIFPNIVPILWTLGLMGYCGIDLSTGTAMIGAVAFGLAVDDTIHYLVHYQRVFNGFADRAVRMTTTRIGRALMISTLALALGFWVGCFGSFKPTIYFSFLVGGTLIGALVCDLLILPSCLMLSSSRPKERSR
jgi:predicted RND superfamily exporter protein